eukprot:1036703_1
MAELDTVLLECHDGIFKQTIHPQQRMAVFNFTVFKQEDELYKSENILSWIMCILDLIEKKPKAIVSMLDAEGITSHHNCLDSLEDTNTDDKSDVLRRRCGV